MRPETADVKGLKRGCWQRAGGRIGENVSMIGYCDKR